jgi:hypothetical protein
MGHTGFEPVTSSMSTRRASQLRQWPGFFRPASGSCPSRAMSCRTTTLAANTRIIRDLQRLASRAAPIPAVPMRAMSRHVRVRTCCAFAARPLGDDTMPRIGGPCPQARRARRSPATHLPYVHRIGLVTVQEQRVAPIEHLGIRISYSYSRIGSATPSFRSPRQGIGGVPYALAAFVVQPHGHSVVGFAGLLAHRRTPTELGGQEH